MRPCDSWPKKVVVKAGWYGCDTGCEGFECEDAETEGRIDFHFGDVESIEDARETFGIPDEVEVEFIPGRLEV